MDKLDKIEALLVLFYLLPGFVGLIVYETCAEVPRRGTFDKFVAAAALTLLSSVIYSFFGAAAGIDMLVDVGDTAKRADAIKIIFQGLGWTTLIAIVLGLIAALAQNQGVLYTLINKTKLGRRTGALDIWHQTFAKVAPEKWIRVVYKDGSAIVGWVQFFSEDLDKQGLFLAEARWGQVPSAGAAPVIKQVIGPGVLLTNFDDVKAIEILDGTMKANHVGQAKADNP